MAMRDYVPVGTPQMFRCRRDRRLVTDHMVRLGVCPGHHLEAPISLTLWEWVKCWLRMIR